MPGIFLRRNGDGGDELVPLHGELYESEAQLQKMLECHPELLLGEVLEAETRPGYLVVVREAGVPEAEGGADRWFLDHLFLDADGVATLVEVKRSSDTRIRREVVGQMLDYAANILAHWPPERMRSEYEAYCANTDSELGPEEKVLELAGTEYEEYWTRVKTNLAAKRLRLVFVADHIPATLQTIVEFLNEQMRGTEVLAVEVKQHAGAGFRVVTTQVIGRTAAAQQAKSVTEKREWTDELILAELRRSISSEAADVAERLLDWARSRGLGTWWGSGPKIGDRRFVITGPDGATIRPFGIWTDGKFFLVQQELSRLRPFDQDDVRRELFRRVGAAAQVPVEDTVAKQASKAFPLVNFLPTDNYDAFVAALDSFVDRARD